MISEGGESYTHLVGAAIVFNLVPKPAALFIFSAYYLMDFVKNLFKSWYAEPRPYWISNDITSSKCWTGFGNPSGHMCGTVFVLFTLFFHKYNEIGIKKERMSVMCTGYIIKMALMASGSVFMIFMAFSRVYLGAHSYN